MLKIDPSKRRSLKHAKWGGLALLAVITIPLLMGKHSQYRFGLAMKDAELLWDLQNGGLQKDDTEFDTAE